ncbi:MAG: stage IV sporulation protein A [Firmicutes bacterium]|nr:stage IV sporulation protein A [Bacillota bacterium]
MLNTSIYEDIGKRAGGDIYIGVVGPVRTGKSTFIKRFMDILVFPNMTNQYEKTRVMDELPQSGEGKTITTTEPKFIPPDSVLVSAKSGATLNVRLVDCVGYMVPGVLGDKEEGKERMVSTPWFEEKIPFSRAAEVGTEKVITEHSVVGVVVTADGTFGEIPRANYVEAEEKTIEQLKSLKKPFVIVLNSATPQSSRSRELAEELEEKYGVPVILANCQRMTEEDFDRIFDKIINQFPACQINFVLPGYMDALPNSHWIKATIIDNVCRWMEGFETIGEAVSTCCQLADGKIIRDIKNVRADMSSGLVTIEPRLDESLYYKVIEELMGAPVESDSQLFMLLSEYSQAKTAYDSIKGALQQVEATDYGIVAPKLSEMVLEKPEVFRQGSKYGVRMKAKAPCLHIIRTDITTEVSPVVGTESQSRDLAELLTQQFADEDADIWETNLFGKTLKEMVTEQMAAKVDNVPDVLRGKVQKSLQRISDEGKDYFICIIL